MEKKSDNKYAKEQIKKERENNSNFINVTEINEKIINNFYKFYKRKVKRFDFLSFLLCGLLIIAIAIYYLIKGNDYFLGAIWNVLINTSLIVIGIGFWISSFKNQKYNKQLMINVYNEDISKVKNEYYFSEEKVIIVNKFGETERVYEYLEAVYEAKYYYYIFTSSTKAYILNKDSFKKGDERKFNAFIKEKVGKKYKKRCIRKK